MPAWLIVALVVSAAYLVTVLTFLLAGRRRDARAFAAFVPDCVVLVRRLSRDQRLPRWNRSLLGLLVLYLVSPIDLVPDFLPVIGQLDDAIFVVLALRLLLRSAGRESVREHWPGPESSLKVVLRVAFGGEPTSG